jgi:hypothetical protein
MSLRLRLLLTLAPLFILGLAAADIGTYAALQSSLLQNVDSQLVAIDGGAENALEQSRPGPFEGGGNGQLPPGTYGELVNASGPVSGGGLYGGYVQTTQSHPVLPSTIYDDANATLTVSGTGTWQSYRVLVTPDPHQPGTDLVVAIPLDGVNTTLSTLLLFEIAISSGITINGALDRGRRPRPSRLAVERAHRGRTARPGAQRNAEPDRAGIRAARCHRAEVAPFRVRRLARAAHTADIDARVCGAAAA